MQNIMQLVELKFMRDCANEFFWIDMAYYFKQTNPHLNIS